MCTPPSPTLSPTPWYPCENFLSIHPQPPPACQSNVIQYLVSYNSYTKGPLKNNIAPPTPTPPKSNYSPQILILDSEIFAIGLNLGECKISRLG